MSDSLVDSNTLFVLNKTDLVPVTEELHKRVATALNLPEDSDRLLLASIEARTGLEELSARLQRLVEERSVCLIHRKSCTDQRADCQNAIQV